MDIHEEILKLLNLNKEHLDLVGYNSFSRSELRKDLEKKIDIIIYEIGATYEFSDKYLNLRALILNDEVKFVKDSKSNITFLQKGFLKLIDIVKQELIDNQSKITEEYNNRTKDWKNIDLSIQTPPVGDEEVTLVKSLLDSPSMLKLRLTLEFLSLNSEMFIHYKYEEFITDILEVYSEEIQLHYDLITTFVDVPYALNKIKEIIKEF